MLIFKYVFLLIQGSSPFLNGSVTVPRKATSKSCQTVDYGNRSAGDGDSSIEDSFANPHPHPHKGRIFEEENQYLMLARRPDGRTDDNIYSTLRLLYGLTLPYPNLPNLRKPFLNLPTLT